MGIITLALIVGNLQDGSNVEPQVWVKVACATAMGLGTAVGGWKIIKTVGDIMKIRPANGAAADISSALTIFVASSFTFPIIYYTRCVFIYYSRCRCFKSCERC